jgi:hypothetical protein
MCVQITEAAEDNDGKNNTFANAQGDNSDNIERKESDMGTKEEVKPNFRTPPT